VVELSHDSRPIIGRGPPLGATFVTLAIASIALMVADQRYDQLGSVRAWLTAAAYPVQVAVDMPFRAWDWVSGSFADRSRLRRDNLELTARLRLANLQLQRFAVLEDENRRLRDMRERTTGVTDRVLVASIMNVDLDPFRHRILLDKGAVDGVFKGQAVLDGEGIVGQVWKVNAATAEAILISDAEHAIPVQSNRSGVRTIAVGTGDSGKLSLPFVTVESDLKVGDLLLSTGMGGVFPPGYPVAQVTRVKRAASATFALVEAKPTAKLDRDREVLLAWFKPPPITEAPAPAAGTPSAPPAGAVAAPAAAPAASPTKIPAVLPPATAAGPRQDNRAPESAVPAPADATRAPAPAPESPSATESTRPAAPAPEEANPGTPQ
jgi:rod shape-determining protein MreC